MAYTNFWTDTDVPTFRVPQILIGDKLEDGQLKSLTHPALRLYLALLCKCTRENKPAVVMDREHIERHADICGKKISRYRRELEDAQLIRYSRTDKGQLYEVLDPHANGLPLIGPTTSSSGKDGKPDLTFEQVTAVFRHYLKDGHLADDANGLRFRCPFHVHVGKAKRSYISVARESGGPWNCLWSECRYNGKHRERAEFLDGTWIMPEHKVYEGGGNVLDFIVAMVELREGRIIDRKAAGAIMVEILSKYPSRRRG